MRQVAELKREKANREREEKKARYSREGIREDKVMRDLKAVDAIKKAASDNLNRTAYHSQYLVQPQQKGVSSVKVIPIQLAHPKITTLI